MLYNTCFISRLGLFRMNFVRNVTFSRFFHILLSKRSIGRVEKQMAIVCSKKFLNPLLLYKNQIGQKNEKLSTSCCLYKTYSSSSNTDDLNDDDLLDVEGMDDFETGEYKDLVNRMFRVKEMGHQVFLIQPYIKWGPSKNELSTPNFQMSESVALIETLKNWKVVDKEIVPLTSFKKQMFFGSGKLEALVEIVKRNKLITAVFISSNSLSRIQQEFLEDEFGVPVFDRYTIVMQIFREHAVTKEAKLQVAMAEIPYLWKNIKSVNNRSSGGTASMAGSGETLYEVRKMLLNEQERKIKTALKKLKQHRQLIRSKRKKRQFPVVAVVGYTNAGKTSLIKAITEEEEMQPKNELFATLDVTCHHGLLPSNIKVLFVDTIGFISDIPTALIEPFVVTLEDAMQADVIVHVVDISNPDHVSQSKHVLKTLEQLKLDSHLLENIISVANKVDLITEDQFINIADDVLPVSSVKGTGLNKLLQRIEGIILKHTDRMKIRIRVANGGPEFSWLYKESSVVKLIADERDAQFILMDVIITKSVLEKFKYNFITSRKHERIQ